MGAAPSKETTAQGEGPVLCSQQSCSLQSRPGSATLEEPKGKELDLVDVSGEEEEAESFQDWCSPRSSVRGSSAPLSPGQSTTSGGTNFMDTRPSADTPLATSRTSRSLEDGGGKSPGMPANDRQSSGSVDHTRSSVGTATGDSCYAQSVRSSFALERASFEAFGGVLEAFQGVGPSAAALAQQAQQQQQQQQHRDRSFELHRLIATLGLPPNMRDRVARLAVFAVQTPVPAGVLSLLWGASEGDVAATLSLMAAKGLINVAKLPDGRVWCLPQQDQLLALQAACKDTVASFHASLLEAYTARGLMSLTDVPDDGYFIQNVGHHMLGAGQLGALRALLLDPAWLVRKLGAAGVAGVVADFRRCLMGAADRDMKLVLESFQMSVGQALAFPHIPGLLRCLMAGRLMTAPLSPSMQSWVSSQQQALAREGQLARARGAPLCMPPTTPSLDQAGGLQRLAMRGHKGAVTKVLLTPSGTDAVTGSVDGTARMWDLEIGDCVLVMEGHTGPITDMAITDDGSLLVTTSEDGMARAFETERGQCLRVLAGHTAKVTRLAMDPWGRFVLTSSADGTCKVWDLSSARAIHTFESGATEEQGGVLCVALSPCTRFAIMGCANNLAIMYDVISGQRMGFMAGHTNWVADVKFFPDGKRAITASHDGTARVWNLNNGTCKHVLEGHKGRINWVAISDDGQLAATASDDGTARLWDLTTGACKKVLQGHTSWVTQVALSPSPDKVVTSSADGTAIAWSLDTGDVIRVLEGHASAVNGVAITRKGRFAVTVSDDSTARVFDFNATSQHMPRWHEGLIHCLAAHSGIAVATAGDDCVARLWDAACGEFRGELSGHRSAIRWAAFSTDGRRLATVSPDRMIKVWDVQTSECLHTMPAHLGSRVKSFAADGDLRYAVVALFDSTVTVWDLQAQEAAAVLQRWGERDPAVGHTSAVNQVLMSVDGTLVVTMSKDCTSRIWDAKSGTCLHVLQGHTDGVVGGCISDIGRILATYSFDGTVRLWALDGGQCVRVVPAGCGIARIALSPDGWKLAIALASNGVLVLDLDHGAVPGGLWQGHSAAVTGMVFSDCGNRLLTCSMDCTARLWNTNSGATEGFFLGDSGLTCCHYDTVTAHVVLGTDRGMVHFLDASGLR